MGHDIPRYDLDVLRWHKDQPRPESENTDRRDAQLWLAMTVADMPWKSASFGQLWPMVWQRDNRRICLSGIAIARDAISTGDTGSLL